jgi:outer membrane lipopolysaccharide assembly protein LptE/RlpB
MRVALVALSLVAGVLAGCGYALVGRGTNVPEDVREVYLSPFENRTQRQQVDQFVTEAIAEELVTRRRFDMVGDRAAADADLSGAVVGFGLTPITFDDQGRAISYEISITAQVLFRRVPGDEVLWRAENYLFRETYEVDLGEGGFLDLEEQALRDAAERFAETMVSDLLEGF